MSSTTTQLTIVNRALQLLGSQSISAITENSTGARSMNAAYTPVLLATLRENLWNFALARAQIAADATAPAFGKAARFLLPTNFVRLAPPDPAYNFNDIDWQIEGGYILSDDGGPLYVRYISSNVTEGQFDPLFAEAFAAKLALACCEQLTQSNTKLQNIEKIYDDTIAQARKLNAFENRPVAPMEDSWITARN